MNGCQLLGLGDGAIELMFVGRNCFCKYLYAHGVGDICFYDNFEWSICLVVSRSMVVFLLPVNLLWWFCTSVWDARVFYVFPSNPIWDQLWQWSRSPALWIGSWSQSVLPFSVLQVWVPRSACIFKNGSYQGCIGLSFDVWGHWWRLRFMNPNDLLASVVM
jgi:hypothetical protein